MKTVLITIRRRGLPARRIVGLFRTTADAIVNTLDTLGDSLAGSRISAQVMS